METRREQEDNLKNMQLRRTQTLVGASFQISAAAGVILLLTDGSLWKLAVSHAYGLVAICAITFAMGISSLLHVRRLYPLAPVWALGVVVLQLGDLVTAPAYNMTVLYFASYLFGLPAFDVLLASQLAVILFYFRGPKPKAQVKKGAYFEAVAKSDRRDFIRIAGSIGFFFVLTIILAVIDLTGAQPTPNNSGESTSSSSGTASTTTAGVPSGAIANLSDLQVGTPLTFYYPDSNHPNALFKLADGSVEAFSLHCTHVCCTVEYDAGSKVFFCPCHASLFGSSGAVLQGPASFPLPKVTLQVDSTGAITPTGVTGTTPCL